METAGDRLGTFTLTWNLSDHLTICDKNREGAVSLSVAFKEHLSADSSSSF